MSLVAFVTTQIADNICQLRGIAITTKFVFLFHISLYLIVDHNFNLISVSTSPLEGGRQNKCLNIEIGNCAVPLYVRCNRSIFLGSLCI
jgi:hypothetical protein